MVNAELICIFKVATPDEVIQEAITVMQRAERREGKKTKSLLASHCLGFTKKAKYNIIMIKATYRSASKVWLAWVLFDSS